MRRVAILLSFLWGVGAALYMVQQPVYASVATGASISRTGTSTFSAPVATRSTLLDVNGPGVLIPLALPAVLALLALCAALWAPARLSAGVSAAAGLLVGLFCVLGAMTIGTLYLPVALLLLTGAVLPARTRASRS